MCMNEAAARLIELNSSAFSVQNAVQSFQVVECFIVELSGFLDLSTLVSEKRKSWEFRV